MISYRIEQRRLRYRDRDFCFISFQVLTEEARRSERTAPDTWFLMDNGKRYTVMPQVPGRSDREVDRALLRWVEHNIDVVAARSTAGESARVAVGHP